MIAIGESFTIDREDNNCFACSQTNPHGLQMDFTRTGDRSAESRYVIAQHYCGFDTVAHGGIQAAVLDEVMSVTTNIHREKYHAVPYATAELSLQYRRPVPVAKPVVIRAELVREEGRDAFIEGVISDEDGQVLTTASGRWRMLRAQDTNGTDPESDTNGTT